MEKNEICAKFWQKPPVPTSLSWYVNARYVHGTVTRTCIYQGPPPPKKKKQKKNKKKKYISATVGVMGAQRQTKTYRNML